MNDPVKELADLLRELDAPIKFGLRAQGHLPKVREMLAQGMPWHDIGRAIGWHGEAVREWFGRENFADQMLTADRKRIRREMLAAIDPEIRMHRIAGSSLEVEVVLVSWLRAEVDRICPEDDKLPACTWTEDENGCWWTGCGQAHELSNDGPSENSMRFCCYCGRPLAEKRSEPEPEEEEEEDHPVAATANGWQWLTTAPRPGTSTIGHPDAGQRGWRTHAVRANPEDSLAGLRRKRAACGLIPRHGWGLDAYIDEKCSRCEAAIERGSTLG